MKFIPSLEGDIPDYIIITNEELKPIFDVLANWKTIKGVPTLVVTTEDINTHFNGCDLAEKIRNYLIQATNYWGTGMFVLLGGDTKIIPDRFGVYSSYVDWSVTDLYYSTVGGNWNANGNSQFGESSDNCDYDPDNFLGRASVEDQGEAEIFINKVMHYEKLDNIPPSDYDYVNNNLYMDGYGIMGSLQYIYSIAPSNIQGHFMCEPSWFPSTYSHEAISRANAMAAFANGGSVFQYGNFHLIYHMDHSNPFEIGTSHTHFEGISTTDMYLPSIDNGDHLAILFSGGCEPNEFQFSSFSEAYINSQYGGVAFIGSSTESYPGDYSFYDNFCNSIYNNNIQNLGCAFQTGPPANNNQDKKKLNLLGDPEMPVWTITPGTITLSATPNPVTNVNNHITVSVILNHPSITSGVVTVCIYKDDNIYNYQSLLCNTGVATVFSFDVYPDTPGDIQITAVANNFLPTQMTLPVEIVGSNLFISDKLIDDDDVGNSSGNSDNHIDAGETIELTLPLTNSGTITTTGISTILTSSSPYVTIIDGNENYNNIVANGTENNLLPYVIQFDPQTPDEYEAEFSLQKIGNGGSYNSTETFYIKVSAPEIQQGNKLKWGM